MTRYRLRDELGGMELPEDTGGVLDLDNAAQDKGVWLIRFDIPGLGRIRVEQGLLEEVKPPLPAQPPPGYYLVNAAPFGFVAEHEAGYGWHVARHSDGLGWDDMCERWPGATYTRLVPDPLVESGPPPRMATARPRSCPTCQSLGPPWQVIGSYVRCADSWHGQVS